MIKNYILKLLTENRKHIYIKNYSKVNKIIKKLNKYYIHSFGNKNSNKVFYVIKREGVGGIFSNILFILDHLILCEKLNAIPVIDWQNFPTVHSEKKENSWTYYFEPVSKYSLKEVYSSKFVILSEDSAKYLTREYTEITKNHLRMYKKYIRIKKYLFVESKKFLKKFKINRFNTIGLHWRGNEMKTAPNHYFPPTKKQITKLLDYYAKNKKIFVMADEESDLDYLKKRYGNKIIFYRSYKSFDPKDVYHYRSFFRKKHRYKLGKEVIVQALIFSNLKVFIGGASMLSDAVYSLFNNRIRYIKINNGLNSKSLIHSLYAWKLKSILPHWLGGYYN